MLKLRDDENYDFKFPASEIKFDFIKSNFSRNNANSKTLISMLNSIGPKSLLSGANIDLDVVLKSGSKHEYHHIFPKKHLERLGKERKEINCLANFCFLTRSDNYTINDKSPNEYGKLISSSNKQKYLNSALIPENFEDLSYEEFLEKRNMALISLAQELMAE